MIKSKVSALGWHLFDKRRAINQQQSIFDEITHIGADSDNIWIRKSSKIPGWLLRGEHEFLWEAGLSAPRGGTFVEIGSLYGKSSCILAGSLIARDRGERMFCIDPFNEAGFQAKLPVKLAPDMPWSFRCFIESAKSEGFLGHIIPVATYSTIAVPYIPGPFSLAFIDARHDEEGAYEDFTLVAPKMLPEGLILFHDVVQESPDYPGVCRAFARAAAHPDFEKIDGAASIAVLRCKKS